MCEMVTVANARLRCCKAKAATDTMETNGHNQIVFTKPGSGLDVAVSHTLLTTGLSCLGTVQGKRSLTLPERLHSLTRETQLHILHSVGSSQEWDTQAVEGCRGGECGITSRWLGKDWEGFLGGG